MRGGPGGAFAGVWFVRTQAFQVSGCVGGCWFLCRWDMAVWAQRALAGCLLHGPVAQLWCAVRLLTTKGRAHKHPLHAAAGGSAADAAPADDDDVVCVDEPPTVRYHWNLKEALPPALQVGPGCWCCCLCFCCCCCLGSLMPVGTCPAQVTCTEPLGEDPVCHTAATPYVCQADRKELYSHRHTQWPPATPLHTQQPEQLPLCTAPLGPRLRSRWWCCSLSLCTCPGRCVCMCWCRALHGTVVLKYGRLTHKTGCNCVYCTYVGGGGRGWVVVGCGGCRDH